MDKNRLVKLDRLYIAVFVEYKKTKVKLFKNILK